MIPGPRLKVICKKSTNLHVKKEWSQVSFIIKVYILASVNVQNLKMINMNLQASNILY